MEIKPDMYVKNILTIPYSKLKQNGIEVLFFDFDNTLLERGNYTLSKLYFDLINNLKKDFKIIIVSNSIHKSKLEKFKKQYNIDYVYLAFKPLSFGFKKAMKKWDLNNNKICMIGDQLLTDIKGGINMKYFSILIDPINNDEHILTKLNRYKEKKYFKRGSYYE